MVPLKLHLLALVQNRDEARMEISTARLSGSSASCELEQGWGAEVPRPALSAEGIAVTC